MNNTFLTSFTHKNGAISGVISGINRDELEAKEKIILSEIETNPNRSTRELSEKERRERKYEANRILESKESEDVRIEAENYIAKKTRGLPVLERIKIVKAEITNVAKGNDLIQPYIEAYENLSTQKKRDNYNKEIEQIDLSKKLKSNFVNVELKEIDDGFSYGDLMVERKKLPTEMLYTNYQGLMIALDREMRYRYYRYKETEKISAIKSKAKMEHKEVLKYFIFSPTVMIATSIAWIIS